MWINVLFPDNSAFSFWLRGPHNICDPLLNLLTRRSQRRLLSDLPVDSTTDCQLQLLTFECAPGLCWCHAFSGLPPVREWTWKGYQCQLVPTWHETSPMDSLAWDLSIGLWNCALKGSLPSLFSLSSLGGLTCIVIWITLWSLFLYSLQIFPSINFLRTWLHHDICSLETQKWHNILAFIKADLHKQILLSPFYSDKITSR